MTKRIVTLLLAVLFVLSSALLVSCGDKNTEAPKSETPTTEAPTTEAPTTEAPTSETPTEAPSTEVPTEPTDEPTTEVPTDEPTEPTDEPTEPTEPTDEPTEPTDEPTPVEAPDINEDPQGYLAWLIEDDGDTTPMCWQGKPYDVIKHPDGTGSQAWEVWGSDPHFHLCYQFDQMDIDASAGVNTEDYAFYFDIWYKDDDVDEPYRMIRTQPWSVYDWGNGDFIIYRIPTYDEGMQDLHSDDGEDNEYDFIFIIRDLDENMLAWREDWLIINDSYELFVEQALNEGIIG